MAFTVALTKNGVGISARVGAQLTGTYGRQDNTSACNPATLSFTAVYDSATLGTLDPNTFQIGDRIILSVQNGALAAANYFSGTLTDIQTAHHEMELVAVSDTLSSVNRSIIDFGAQTGQLTGTVINDALTSVQSAGGLPSKTITASSGTNTVTTAAQTAVSAGTFIQTVVASEPSGVLLEEIGGIRFSDYNDRRVSTMPAAQKFDFSALGSVIDWDWQLEKTISDFVNSTTVSYTGGTSTYADTTSVSSVGLYSRGISTVIYQATDADYMALRTTAHGLSPGWRTSGVIIDMAGLSDANRDAVMKNMRTGSYIKLPTLLSGAQTQFFVEGWSDQITYSATGTKQWFRTLYVSDITISQAAQRYVDVTSGVTYATVNATYRYIDLESRDI